MLVQKPVINTLQPRCNPNVSFHSGPSIERSECALPPWIRPKLGAQLDEQQARLQANYP